MTAGTISARWLLGCLLVLSSPCAASAADGTGALRVTTFVADVTPPLGEPVGLGFVASAKTVEHPLMAKGVLLEDSGTVHVLCAIDWMEVHNSSHGFLRARIGKAAGTTSSRVVVQCVHQHTAPAINADAQRLQLGEADPRRIATSRYVEETADRIAASIGEARTRWQALTHVAVGMARVDRVASNRRIEQPDGSIVGRMSSTRDAALRAAPEGLIDPWLRTVSLESGERVVAQLHYYATHPQSFYGDGRISHDVPGIARQRLQKQTGVFQIYFTGCGGDVAMGKYNDGTREAPWQSGSTTP